MNPQESPLQVVIAVVRGMQDELGYDRLSEAGADTALFGGDDGLDSLSVVRIVAELERVAGRQFGKRLVLADERALSRRSSPFRTVGTLAELLAERLAE